VNGVSGMQEKGRGAGRVEGSYNLLGNDGAFANAAHYHPAPALHQRVYGFFKMVVNVFLELQDGFAFQPYSAPGAGYIGFRLQAVKISPLAETIKDEAGSILTFLIRRCTGSLLNSHTLRIQAAKAALHSTFSKAHIGWRITVNETIACAKKNG
jgi:hypothetical protein